VFFTHKFKFGNYWVLAHGKTVEVYRLPMNGGRVATFDCASYGDAKVFAADPNKVLWLIIG